MNNNLNILYYNDNCVVKIIKLIIILKKQTQISYYMNPI